MEQYGVSPYTFLTARHDEAQYGASQFTADSNKSMQHRTPRIKHEGDNGAASTGSFSNHSKLKLADGY